MKPVLLVSEFFPPEPGGIQRSLKLLQPAWGDDVQVISPVHQSMYSGLQRSLFSGRHWPHWGWLVGQFWRHARRGRRTIVFGHFSLAITAAWMLRSFGVRYVILAHGHDLLSETVGLKRVLVGRLIRGADWVGVNSTWLADRLHHLGVPRGRLVKTHPAVADDELQVGAGTRAGNKLLTIARLVPRKNIGAVLEAVARLIPTHPHLQYHLVGDGPDREQLEALVTSLGLTKVVVWHGPADESTRRRLLAEADIFVLVPNVRQSGADVEGLGAVFLEAGAASVPLVASDTGGITDIVIDGQTGCLADPTNPESIAASMRTLLASTELRRQYGAAAKALVMKEFRASIRTSRAATMLNGPIASDQPLISLIIPAYNSTKTIGTTLTSVFRQSWSKYEIIVVDDGSTDDLAATLQPWRDRLTLIRQTHSGAPAARNRGAAAAIGEYLLFLDSDITADPDLLMSLAIGLSTHPEAAYAYCDFTFGLKNFHLFDFSATRLRRMNFIHTTSLIRREAFPGFDHNLKRFQDWDVWLTMLAHNQTGLWIPRRLFRVNQRQGTMSAWVPSFIYRLPLIGRGIGNANIRKYRAAEAVIRQKHRLD